MVRDGAPHLLTMRVASLTCHGLIPRRPQGGRLEGSVLKAARPTSRLDVAAVFLAFQATLLRPQRWSGRSPWNGPGHRLAQQLDQAVDRIHAVALLGTEPLSVNHDHAILGHALAGEADEPGLRVRRQRDPSRVEPQLYGG